MTRTRVALVVMLLAAGSLALAAQPPAASAAQEGFVPVGSLPQPEQMPAVPLVIAAYSFVWVALVGYVWLLWRRLAKVERELADLSRRLQDR